MEGSEVGKFVPYVVTFNFAVVGVVLFVAGRVLTKGELTEGVPGPRQNVGEFMLDFFVNKARDMGDSRVVRTVAPFLATCFFMILLSNAVAIAPVPILNYPPTAFFSVTLGLALSAIIGTLIISGVVNGALGAIKHLFWPNPLQWISEITDVLSLSLRLFGNIGGEYMTIVLVSGSVAFGIPLILHVIGLIPTFVQALVFTLLTASFVAGAIHHEDGKHEVKAKALQAEVSGAASTGPQTVEGQTESGEDDAGVARGRAPVGVGAA